MTGRLKRANSPSEYQRIQRVLMRATLGHSAKEGEAIFDARGRGGRRHPHPNAETMSLSLAELAQRHADEFGLMAMRRIPVDHFDTLGRDLPRARDAPRTN